MNAKNKRIDEFLCVLEDLVGEIKDAASEADVAVSVIRSIIDWNEDE